MALIPMEQIDSPLVVEGTNNMGDGTSVSSGTLIIVNSVTFPAKGLWLIIAKADWTSDGNGVRQISFNNSINPQRQMANTTAGFPNAKETYQELSLLANITNSSTTYNLYAYQNSGRTLSIYPYIQAYKLAD